MRKMQAQLAFGDYAFGPIPEFRQQEGDTEEMEQTETSDEFEVVCLECGEQFECDGGPCVECPGCGSSDLDLA